MFFHLLILLIDNLLHFVFLIYIQTFLYYCYNLGLLYFLLLLHIHNLHFHLNNLHLLVLHIFQFRLLNLLEYMSLLLSFVYLQNLHLLFDMFYYLLVCMFHLHFVQNNMFHYLLTRQTFLLLH